MKNIKLLAITSILLLSGMFVGVQNAVSFEYPARWIGSGTIGNGQNPCVNYRFALYSNVNQLPNNLEVYWGSNYFHMDALIWIDSWDDPSNPRVGCDTIYGYGDGKLNGVSGYHVEFMFTDAGGPGINDLAGIWITDSSGNTVMYAYGFLKYGDNRLGLSSLVKKVSTTDTNIMEIA